MTILDKTKTQKQLNEKYKCKRKDKNKHKKINIYKKLTKLSKHKNIQTGGSLENSKNNTTSANENFQVNRLTNFDYKQYSVVKSAGTIDWGSNMPGPPPTDCCIL